MSADIRERVARAIATSLGREFIWERYLTEADAVLAELGLTTAEPVGEWVMVPRDALGRWRDAFAEELGAWDIDPPLHHVKTSHDEIEAMLTAPLGAAALAAIKGEKP